MTFYTAIVAGCLITVATGTVIAVVSAIREHRRERADTMAAHMARLSVARYRDEQAFQAARHDAARAYRDWGRP